MEIIASFALFAAKKSISNISATRKTGPTIGSGLTHSNFQTKIKKASM
jgi:hypothetical protein